VLKENFIMTIKDIDFFDCGLFYNKFQIICTQIKGKYDETYHVPINSNLEKECKYIYKLWYEN